MMAPTRPARHGVARFVAIATIVLAAATILGAETVTTTGADTQPPSADAATLLEDDAVHGAETVGVRPPRAPDIGRAGGVATVRSVTLAVAVAAVAASLACVGACRGFRRPADDRLPARAPRAWAGPGGRRAPPLAHAA
jgi:hypothetical protein